MQTIFVTSRFVHGLFPLAQSIKACVTALKVFLIWIVSLWLCLIVLLCTFGPEHMKPSWKNYYVKFYVMTPKSRSACWTSRCSCLMCDEEVSTSWFHTVHDFFADERQLHSFVDCTLSPNCDEKDRSLIPKVRWFLSCSMPNGTTIRNIDMTPFVKDFLCFGLVYVMNSKNNKIGVAQTCVTCLVFFDLHRFTCLFISVNICMIICWGIFWKLVWDQLHILCIMCLVTRYIITLPTTTTLVRMMP